MDKKTSDVQLNEFTAANPAQPENSGEVNSSGKFTALFRTAKSALHVLFSGNLSAFFIKLKSFLVGRKIRKLARRNPNIAVLPVAQIVVTQKCTLKCKGCANLMQYYKEPKNIGIEQIYRDIDALFKNVNKIGTVHILGGEPLMIKNLPDILAHLEKYKKQYSLLMIATNGTICPPPETIKAIKQFGAIVGISNYKENSVNLNSLSLALKKEKIPFSAAGVFWRSVMVPIDGNLRSSAETLSVYKNCQMVCAEVMNGKLYRCPFLTHGDELRVFPESPDNYVDLLDPSLTPHQINDYMNRKAAYSGCKFCSGYNLDLAEPIPTAEQIKEPLPYVRQETVHSEN